MPLVVNINPRSIYGKDKELKSFITEQSVDCAFLSETWERLNFPLENLMNMDGYKIISNPYQRTGRGGRPALIVKREKYEIKNLTNTIVDIPWGLEAVWVLLTPKERKQNQVIKKIVLCSFYSPPKSNSRFELIDHICGIYHLLSAKYGQGLHFIIAGDSNDMKLDSILQLSPNMIQVVKDYTRMNPPAILDPIITTLANFYQTPECLQPLGPDCDSLGVESDHKIVLMKPINSTEKTCSRTFRDITFRPITDSGMYSLEQWFHNQSWEDILNEESVNNKAVNLQDKIMGKVNEYLPLKNRKIANDDQPWYTGELKKLNRKKAREYKKHRKSEKYMLLNAKYDLKIKMAKRKYKREKIDDVLTSSDRQWYSKLKRLTQYDQEKFQPVNVEEIENYSDKIQAELIADRFAKVSNEYKPIDRNKIKIPPFTSNSIPKIFPYQVEKKLEKIKANKASVPGDIPAIIIKRFAKYISIPLCNLINSCIEKGQWPQLYKIEAITPIPKKYPTTEVSMLRPISLLYFFERTMESLIGDIMINDMKNSIDPSQFGNKKNTSINNYLLKMLNRIVTSLDDNSKGAVNAVLCLFVDYEAAFSRMCHTIGVNSFINNGVRASLIPCLISYFEDRQMFVRWHGEMSTRKQMPGSGAMGATFGILEFLSQTNNNSDNIPIEDKYKYFDDLTTLEVINMLSIGLTSLNVKNQVASDLPIHGQFIDKSQLKSQKYLEDLNAWSQDHEMVINQKKTKAMIFNFTNKYQFHTRLTLKNENIEIVDTIKLLGTQISNDLSWDENCKSLVKKVNARMQLLQKCKILGSSNEEMVLLWILYCRSVLENSCVVWSSSLTMENKYELERTQKSFCKMVLEKKYINYEKALLKLNLTTLEDRRNTLNLKFAQNAIKYNTLNSLFIRKENKYHHTRNNEVINVFHANTDRKRKFSVIQMQHQLNNEAKRKKH